MHDTRNTPGFLGDEPTDHVRLPLGRSRRGPANQVYLPAAAAAASLEYLSKPIYHEAPVRFGWDRTSPSEDFHAQKHLPAFPLVRFQVTHVESGTRRSPESRNAAPSVR